jgi:hypothetical protein
MTCSTRSKSISNTRRTSNSVNKKTQHQPKQQESNGLELSEGQAKKVSFPVHNNNNSPMSLGRLSIPQSEAKTSGKSSVLRLSKSDKRD